MKMRNLLAIVVMLSIFLFGIGTALAITGVEDAVPGQDVIIPIICEGNQPNVGGVPSGDPVGDPVFGSLNTIWAIAEKMASTCTMDQSVCTPKNLDGTPKLQVPGAIAAEVFVMDRFSRVRLDTNECWSKRDVISSDCQTLLGLMTSTDRDAMELTISGKTYFVGYVQYKQSANCALDVLEGANALLPWIYLNDITKGFASGMNGISMENGTGPELEELCLDGSCDGNFIGVTARSVYPRYFILNDNADSFNWWIFLLGRNEYAVEGTTGLVPSNNIHRQLTCVFCDENEKCFSNNIPIPNELNIIDVKQYIPGGVYASGTYPKAGFALCDVDEVGYFTGDPTQTVIAGTLSFDSVDTPGNTLPETYSLFGYSYQRAVPTSVSANIAAIHTIHRVYCADAGDAWELPERFETGTVDQCSMPHNFLAPVTP